MASLCTNNKHISTNIIVVTLFLSSLALISANGIEVGESSNKVAKISSNKVRININNTMGGGVWIGLRCKSKNDDLGFKILRPNENYMFSFEPNFWGTTLFYCHVTWKWQRNSNQISHYFDAYVNSRDKHRCPRGYECCWNLKPSGPCKCKGYQTCYKWNKN